MTTKNTVGPRYEGGRTRVSVQLSVVMGNSKAGFCVDRELTPVMEMGSSGKAAGENAGRK
jgi:hypothetical protein